MFKSAIKDQVLSIIFAVITAVVFALILSLLKGLFNFGTGVIKPINQVLKTIAIFFSALLFLRGEKGLVKGLITGLATAFLTALIASAFSGNFLNGLIFDLLLFGAIGAVSGVIAVNVKTK